MAAKPSEQLAVQIHFHVSAIKRRRRRELLINFCRATLCTSSTKVVSKANRLANWLLAFLFYWLPNKNCTQRFSQALQLYENINRSGTMSTSLHCRKKCFLVKTHSHQGDTLPSQEVTGTLQPSQGKTNDNSEICDVLGWEGVSPKS